MHGRDVTCQSHIDFTIIFVLDDPEEVKTREQGGGQLNIRFDRAFGIVATIRRIGRSQYRCSSVQRG